MASVFVFAAFFFLLILEFRDVFNVLHVSVGVWRNVCYEFVHFQNLTLRSIMSFLKFVKFQNSTRVPLVLRDKINDNQLQPFKLSKCTQIDKQEIRIPNVYQQHYNYNLDRLDYKLFDWIYDIVVMTLSILDKVTYIFVLIELFDQRYSSEKIYRVCVAILFVWSAIIHILLMIIFIKTICVRYIDEDTWREFSPYILLFSIIITPIAPIIHYFATIRGMIHENDTLFKFNKNHPLLYQFCTISRNKHSLCVIQTLGESIPAAMIQTIALIYQSNNYNPESIRMSALQFWLCVSITTTFITAIVELLLLIDWTRNVLQANGFYSIIYVLFVMFYVLLMQLFGYFMTMIIICLVVVLIPFLLTWLWIHTVYQSMN